MRVVDDFGDLAPTRGDRLRSIRCPAEGRILRNPRPALLTTPGLVSSRRAGVRQTGGDTGQGVPEAVRLPVLAVWRPVAGAQLEVAGR
jgi:hypothetical protein